MDAVLFTVAMVGGKEYSSERVGLELVGRWAAGLAHGRCRYADIADAPAIQGEALWGLATHYFTGITLTGVFFEMQRRRGRKLGFVSATAFGAATALLPLLVMYPSWGLGPFAVRSEEAARLVRLMLLGHTAFGAAMGLWAGLLKQPASAYGHSH